MNSPAGSLTEGDSGRVIDPLVPLGDGHTELPHDDRHSLIPTHISTRGELNEAEQRNISTALLRKTPPVEVLLTDRYLRDLHEAMLGDVWEWAGNYRQTTPNIGIDWYLVPPAVADLTEDVKVWIEHETFEPDEIAVRFHHRLVAIHPFLNGNGRHSRISADYLAMGLGNDNFSWGAHLEVDTEELRKIYIGALQQADDGDITQLLEFARS